MPRKDEALSKKLPNAFRDRQRLVDMEICWPRNGMEIQSSGHTLLREALERFRGKIF
jgi:hypothetical protein